MIGGYHLSMHPMRVVRCLYSTVFRLSDNCLDGFQHSCSLFLSRTCGPTSVKVGFVDRSRLSTEVSRAGLSHSL